MPIVTSKKMFADAYAGGYAIGAYNMHNVETTEALVWAAEQAEARDATAARPERRKAARPETAPERKDR